MPRTTISGWYKKYQEDEAWRPTAKKRDLNRRIFLPEQEAAIKKHLIDEYISKQKPLTIDTIRTVMFNYVYEDMEPLSDGVVTAPDKNLSFKCSRHFIMNFLRRNGLSNRVCTAERRPQIDPIQVDGFQALLKEAIEDNSNKIILNADETQWRVLMPPKRSVAKVGQDSVKLNIDGDKKAGFTILATISSDGEKLPLVFIAKGKSKSCHKQLGTHPKFEFIVYHSQSGWITEEIFCEYLIWIQSIIQNKKIYLIVDQYGSHFGSDAMAKAKELNINLIPVPKGGTAEYQPLDRGIFGIMKAKGKSKWTRICHNNPSKKWDKQTAVHIALQCWKQITKTQILKAWNFEAGVISSATTSESDTDFLPIIKQNE